MAKTKWTEELTTELSELASAQVKDGVLAYSDAVDIAEKMELEIRSVTSKLRNIGFNVAKKEAKKPTFTDAEAEKLRNFLEDNYGIYTYSEITEKLFGDSYSPRAVQGKILAMELSSHVKPSEKKTTPKSFTEDEESSIVDMATDGSYLEDIAEALGKSVNQIRGKALSMLRAGTITQLPQQKVKKADNHSNMFSSVLNSIADLTVSQLAEQLDRSEVVIKSGLTRNKLKCADYDGEQRAATLAEKRLAEAD